MTESKNEGLGIACNIRPRLIAQHANPSLPNSCFLLQPHLSPFHICYISLQLLNSGSFHAHIPKPFHILLIFFRLYFLHRFLFSPIQLFLNLPDSTQISSPWENFSGSQVRLSTSPVLRIQESYLGINHTTLKLWFCLFSH